ncbi:MAG: anti-sigma factor [Actinomycetota bacterium]|nr:anti-sigma factor [Actinomycetota bacterium]
MNLSASPNNNDDLHHLAGAYALGALDDIDSRRFERHLAECPTCREEVDSFAPAAEHLADAVAVEAPGDLRSRVLGEIDRTRQVSPLPSPARPRRPRTATLVAAAASIVAVLFAGLFLTERSRTGELGEVAAVLEAGDVRVVDLDGGSGALRVLYSPAEGSGLVLAGELAAAPEGRTYQLWVVDGDDIGSVGLFHAGEVTRLALAAPPPEGSVLAVTVEPAGGSDQPTSDPDYASAPL